MRVRVNIASDKIK